MNREVHQANRENGREYIIRDNIRVPVVQKEPSSFFEPSPKISNQMRYEASSKKYQKLIGKSNFANI